MSDYPKQKLYEALRPLLADGPLKERLTFAAVPLTVLREDDFAPEYRRKFRTILEALTGTPLSDASSYRPRAISDDEARIVAKDILDLYTGVMGGL